MMSSRSLLTMSIGVLLLTAPASGQWLGHRTEGIPRTSEGQPNFAAPAPRMPDRRIDFSGLWQLDPQGKVADALIGTARLSAYFSDITADLAPKDVPFLPWAEAEYQRRQERFAADDPAARCQPYGVPSINTFPAPFKIVHTPRLMVILYEAHVTYRQIFLDGRSHPEVSQPSWMGYSVGGWDGDTLVVETIGFNDRTWLDRRGHPHTEGLRVTERFRRPDFGHLEIHTTIEDSKAYTKPITFVDKKELLADSELLEYVCTDNEKFSSRVN